ncbi:hypothetical protein L195_g035591 [Trifolium pratense]|uniref:Uncharacterized protein n=1 Tax=Trifolium pratense TaxID=57577 RepID=A0A2K3LM44_TRIPR|nr:hypothetical protein L195_g035591 [Trifolium pratense]
MHDLRREDRAGVCSVKVPVEMKGDCVPVDIPTLKSVSPQRWAKTLDGIYGHQVAAGKQLESHDEQLMLIIPVNGRYNASSVVTIDA